MTPREILLTYWGHTSFRPMQEEIIQEVMKGRDSLAILPTGGGKSVCFQVPAMALPGLCLVVTPLIALMEDQLAQLSRKGIAAASLYAGLSTPENRRILQEAVEGVYKFLYVSPERLQTDSFLEALPWMPLCLLAVDEAHCISQWGHDFRPTYLQIASVRKWHKEIPVLALTASATARVQAEIAEKLALRNPSLFRQSFERPNLSYHILPVESRSASLVEILRKTPGSSIVYCRSRRKTVDYAGWLQRSGLPAAFYHAGLDREARKTRQLDWVQNKVQIIVATNAFGMGIDKPDVRCVIHTEPPDSLENFYQEAGRAGRDGQAAKAYILSRPMDAVELLRLPDIRYPALSVIRKVYQSLANYLQLPSGIGEDRTYALDIRALAERFQLKVPEVLHSLQAMQQEGILDFQEQAFRPSTVHFITTRDQWQAQAVLEPELEPLIQSLLRSYTGIVDGPVPIVERALARTLRQQEALIRQQLTRLHRIGIIIYQPALESPHIRFLQNRVKADDLYIDMAAYLERKQHYSERIAGMVGYLSTNNCRAAYIGQYFGDHWIRDCGHCDICLARDKTTFTSSEVHQMSLKIKAALDSQPLALDILAPRLSSNEALFKSSIEALRKEGYLILDEDGKLHWRS